MVKKFIKVVSKLQRKNILYIEIKKKRKGGVADGR